MNKTTESNKNKTREIVFIALFAVLMAVCSWISIPTAIPITIKNHRQKTVGAGCFDVGRSCGLLHCRYGMVYGCICTEYRPGWAMDSSALVRDSVYRS